jgi:hypothetical protein
LTWGVRGFGGRSTRERRQVNAGPCYRVSDAGIKSAGDNCDKFVANDGLFGLGPLSDLVEFGYHDPELLRRFDVGNLRRVIFVCSCGFASDQVVAEL